MGKRRKRGQQLSEQGVQTDGMPQIAEDFIDITETSVGQRPVQIIGGLLLFLMDRFLETGDRAFLIAGAGPGMTQVVPR